MSSTTAITKGNRRCIPFLLEVMIFSPESGYKFSIKIQKACSTENDPIWGLVFDLFRKNDKGDFDQVTHINFTAGTPDDTAKVAAISDDGMTRPQVRAFRQNVYPLVKPLAESDAAPTDAQNKAIHDKVQEALRAS